MNQSQPFSRLFWVVTAAASRMLLWLVIAVWVMFALAWMSLHWVIVPRIGEFRPRLEIEASRIVGVPVKIGEISARSVGVIPSFELKNVALLDEAGREALKLPSILTSVSPASLLQLSVEQILIEAPELNIRRDRNGKITVAGFDFSKNEGDSGGAADWFFSQPEFVIRNGRVHWVDEMPNGALGAPPPLTLQQVDFVSRNPLNKHELRLDATPPAVWGERFSVRGLFTQSLLSPDKGKFKDWTGQVFADFGKIDVSEISRYVKLNDQSGKGVGALKAWTVITKGDWVSTTADVSLAQVDATLGQGLQPLALQSMSGRLIGKKLAQGFEASTQNLQFQTQDGLRWPGGNLQFSQTNPTYTSAFEATDPLQTINDFKADKLDLAVISLIANKIPLGADTHELLTSLAPQGSVETISANWRGKLVELQALTAKGKINGLQIASKSSQMKTGEGLDAHETIGRPGFRGASVDFDLNLDGGKAKLNIDKGDVNLPGIFEDAVVPLDKVSADIVWKITRTSGKNNQQKSAAASSASASNSLSNSTANHNKIEVSVNNLTLQNADAQGAVQLKWRTSDPATYVNKSRLPGVLDLTAKLENANLNRVARYLPLGIPKKARDYVRDLLQEGNASEIDFKIKGEVWDIPASKPELGDFRVAAKFSNARVAYVPKRLIAEGELVWPDVQKINGEVVVDRKSLVVKSTNAEIVNWPNLSLGQTVVTIPELNLPVVAVTTQGKGPLVDIVGFVNKTPLLGMTNQALNKASVNGVGEFNVDLSMPIADLTKSRVKGDVVFLGNDVQMTPDTPLLLQAKGLLRFSEKGFAIQDAQANMFGGDVRFEGGNLSFVSSSSSSSADGQAPTPNRGVVIRGQGTATAQGLQRANDLGIVPRLAKHASGSAAYSVQLKFGQDMTEVSVQSNLLGMALAMPSPFNKPAQASWPMRFENTLLESSTKPERDGKIRIKDSLRLNIEKIADLKLVRDISGAAPKVIRASYSVGLEATETTAEPANAVAANINVDRLDVDEWTKFFATLQASASNSTSTSTSAVTHTNTPSSGQTSSQNQDAQQTFDDLIPSIIAMRTKELVVDGRKFENIVIGGSREGSVWRTNVEAKQLSGYFEYRQPTPSVPNSRVYARLSRLVLEETQVKDVEKLLDEQPKSIPAFDLVVEDFELKGRKYGRVEVDAVNRTSGLGESARFWRLNKLNMTTPEAKFTANGLWAYRDGARNDAVFKGESGLSNVATSRTTGIDFKLEILDTGKLLDRFGFKSVVRGGKGNLDGQLTWIGSPLAMNYPTLAGQFNVSIDEGQFLKVEPGVAKLLSVLSLQSISKRLNLDFRDVFSDGFIFDFIKGDVTISKGTATTNNLQMSGLNAVILMDGKSDIATGMQDIRVVVAPEVNAGIASILVATAINPAIGLGTFLAQIFLRQPLIEAVTKEYKVQGTWSDPIYNEVKRTPRNIPNPGSNPEPKLDSKIEPKADVKK